MARVFRPSNRESKILSRIESNKEYQRRQALHLINQHLDAMSNTIAQKLVETGTVETTSKNSLEEEVKKTLDQLSRMEDFDIDYQIAPWRRLVHNPHVVSLYLTAWVLEKLINHKDVIDVFGEDIDVYQVLHQQVAKFLP